jgi:hypothetical protein
MQAAEEHVKFSKELEISSKATVRSNFRIFAFPINIGDAALVVENSGFSDNQRVFIRRDNALWQVSISYSTVFDQAKVAGQRVTQSIKFKN